MHSIQSERIVLSYLHDILACTDCLLVICIESCTILRVLQLKGYSVHDIANNQIVSNLIYGMTSCMTISFNSLYSAWKRI